MIFVRSSERIESGNSYFFTFQGYFLCHLMVYNEVSFLCGQSCCVHNRLNFWGIIIPSKWWRQSWGNLPMKKRGVHHLIAIRRGQFCYDPASVRTWNNIYSFDKMSINYSVIAACILYRKLPRFYGVMSAGCVGQIDLFQNFQKPSRRITVVSWQCDHPRSCRFPDWFGHYLDRPLWCRARCWWRLPLSARPTVDAVGCSPPDIITLLMKR